MTCVLFIDPDTHEQIRAVCAFAALREHWYVIGATGPTGPIPGTDPRHCVGVSLSYRVVYSILVHPAVPYPCRHLTLSAPKHAPLPQQLPGPTVFRELIREFGFTDAANIAHDLDPDDDVTPICIAQERFYPAEEH